MTRSTSTPNALVLPVEAVSTHEAVTFPGFPGEWRPGNPVRLETLGLELMEARAKIADLGLPLVELDHRKKEESAVPDRNPPLHEGNAGFDPGVGSPEPPHEAEDVAPSDAPPAVPAEEAPGGAE